MLDWGWAMNFAISKPALDSEVVLVLAYVFDAGDTEPFPSIEALCERFGLAPSEQALELSDMALAVRKSGVPFERFNLEKIAADLTGWDLVRLATAFAEARAAGWLTKRGGEIH